MGESKIKDMFVEVTHNKPARKKLAMPLDLDMSSESYCLGHNTRTCYKVSLRLSSSFSYSNDLDSHATELQIEHTKRTLLNYIHTDLNIEFYTQLRNILHLVDDCENEKAGHELRNVINELTRV